MTDQMTQISWLKTLRIEAFYRCNMFHCDNGATMTQEHDDLVVLNQSGFRRPLSNHACDLPARYEEN
jgi:hypothetical protein